jgi:hypothetical protein
LKCRWLDGEELGQLIENFIKRLMDIEDNWNSLDDKRQFEEFIHHQKLLMAAQLIEWHGVRREVISMQSINNVSYESYRYQKGHNAAEVRTEYTYHPPTEKVNHGFSRNLCVSEGKITAKINK